MDIDLLSKMVKELILDDDKVVLPGLGCFVAEIVPAYFSDKGYTINPPYRKLYFRARPDEGDSLIDFYARSNDVSYDVAERIIKDFVSELKTVLHAKKVVVFPGLGRLRATKENNVFFIADEDLDIYPEGFGLEPISLKTHKETAAEVSAAVAGLKTMLETEPDVEILVEPVPDPIPDPVPDSVPVSDVIPEVVPESDSLPETGADAEPDQQPDQVSDQQEESKQEPAPDPIPDSKPDPQPESKPESEQEPDQKPEQKQVTEVTPAPIAEKPAGKRWGRVFWIILAVLVLLVVAYMAVGRLCPEWIDQFLYTPEELEILNR